MSQQETGTAVKTAPTKKQVRKEISEKLKGALAEYQQDLGEKKLATHVKNVSKLISRDLLKITKKKQLKEASGKTTRVKAKIKKVKPKK